MIPSMKSIAAVVLTVVVAAAIFGIAFFALTRLWPRHDTTPVEVARKDEKTASAAATTIGAAVQGQNDDATLHIDITGKDIHDAFDALPPPAPQPTAGAEPRPVPAAPVDRLRDAINEGVARANRAAGDAGAAD